MDETLPAAKNKPVFLDKSNATDINSKPEINVHIIDELLEERCHSLMRYPFIWRAIKWLLYAHLHAEDAKNIVNKSHKCDCSQILETLEHELALNYKFNNKPALPATGPCIIIANHPTGMIDGLAIYFALKNLRNDFAIFSNRDAIRVAVNLADILIPVEWMEGNRTPQRMRETLKATKQAFDEQKAVVIFPAGGIAKMTPKGIREHPWLDTTVKLAKRHNVPIVPVHIHARNSWSYYLLELCHKELRDLTRFREMALKRNSTFEFTFGDIINIEELDHFSPGEATAKLRKYVEDDLPQGKKFSP